MTPDQQIDSIMQHFDFATVARMMKTLKWCWLDGPTSPTVSDLKVAAYRILTRFARDPKAMQLRCGGFMAHRFGKKKRLQLTFELASYVAGEEDWE